MTCANLTIFLKIFENSHDPYEEEDILVELSRKAAAGRVLLLLDGLDEVHGVGSLANIKMPAGKVQFSCEGQKNLKKSPTCFDATDLKKLFCQNG